MYFGSSICGIAGTDVEINGNAGEELRNFWVMPNASNVSDSEIKQARTIEMVCM